MARSKNKLSPERFAAIARAVAEPRRFAILQQVAGQEVMSCSGLHAQDCISPATISHHLKELQEAGLVLVEREGRTARLTFLRPTWEAYLHDLQNV